MPRTKHDHADTEFAAMVTTERRWTVSTHRLQGHRKAKPDRLSVIPTPWSNIGRRGIIMNKYFVHVREGKTVASRSQS